MESLINKEEINKDKMEEILGKSKAGEVLPPKRGFLKYFCPQCGKKVKTRYFEEVWNILGRFAICYQFFECLNCGWKYAKRVYPP
jgi:predicted RNA-binding Zn-ribbon protein involved in translation (DUF1610 family)